MILAAGHLIYPKFPISRTGQVNHGPQVDDPQPDKVDLDRTIIWYG